MPNNPSRKSKSSIRPWLFAYLLFFLPISAAALFSHSAENLPKVFQVWAIFIYAFANFGTLLYATGSKTHAHGFWKLIFAGFVLHYFLGGIMDHLHDPVSPEWILPLWLFVLTIFYPAWHALFALSFQRSLPDVLLEFLRPVLQSKKRSGKRLLPLALTGFVLCALFIFPAVSFFLARSESSRVIHALHEYKKTNSEYPRDTAVLKLGKLHYFKTLGYDTDGKKFVFSQKYAPYEVYDVYDSETRKWKNGWIRTFDYWTGAFFTYLYEQCFLKNNYLGALRVSEAGLKYFEMRFGQASIDTAEVAHMAALAAKALGRYGEAQRYFERAEQSYLVLPDADLLRRIHFYNNFGNFYLYLGKFAEAARVYEKSWDLVNSQDLISISAAGDTYTGFGSALAKTGQTGRAKRMFHAALRFYQKNQAPAIFRASCYQGLADLFADSGYLDRAASLYLKAVAIWSRRYDEHAGLIASAKNSLGMIYYRRGDLMAAERLIKEAIKLYKRNPVLHRLDILVAENFLGMVLHSLGEQDKAQSIFDRVSKEFEALLGTDHVGLVSPVRNQGAVALDSGRYDKAEALFQRAIGIMENAKEERGDAYLGTLLDLAAVYEKQEKWDHAEQAYRRLKDTAKNLHGEKSEAAVFAAGEFQRFQKERKAKI